MKAREEKLGAILVQNKLITDEQLRQVREAVTGTKPTTGSFQAALVGLGYISETDMIVFLSKQYSVPVIDLAQVQIDPELIKLVPRAVADKHVCIPISRSGTTLIVAMADPSKIFAIDDLKYLTGYNIEVMVASETAIQAAIQKYYQGADAEAAIGEEPEMGEETGDLREGDDPGMSGFESAKGAYLCLLLGTDCESLEGGGLFVVNATNIEVGMEQLKMLRGNRTIPASMNFDISFISVSSRFAQIFEKDAELRAELARLLRSRRR